MADRAAPTTLGGSVCPRPPDRRGNLPGKISVQCGAYRHPEDASAASALDRHLRPARGSADGLFVPKPGSEAP
jgi:hypothetical protein